MAARLTNTVLSLGVTSLQCITDQILITSKVSLGGANIWFEFLVFDTTSLLTSCQSRHLIWRKIMAIYQSD